MAISFHYWHSAFVPHHSARFLRPVPIYLYANSFGRCCASRHHHATAIRSGTSAAILPRFLSPCVSTASFNLVTSSSVHVPVPVHQFVLCHLFHTEFSLDQEPERQFHPNSCHQTFLQFPSACCLRLLSIYPCVHPFARPMLGCKASCHLLHH
jgi:hypothetical protein